MPRHMSRAGCAAVIFAGVKVLENGQHHFCCEIETDAVPIDKVVQETLKRTGLKDVTIEDLSMEEVISILYGKKA